MLTESLQRIAKSVRDMAGTWPGLYCFQGGQKLVVTCPRDAILLDISQVENVGYDERICVNEYRPHSHRSLVACSAWEAVTTITQCLMRRT